MRALSAGMITTLRLDTIRRQAQNLTRAQRRLLESLTDDWRREEHDWKCGVVFHRLEGMGLCEMKDVRVKGGDVTTGPGNTSVYRWHTRRTEAGKRVLAELVRG